MSRERFIRELEYFTANYNAICNPENKVSAKIDSSRAEWLAGGKQWAWGETFTENTYSHIDITRVKRITLNNGNCFEYFYENPPAQLYSLFMRLSKIEMVLKHLDKFGGYSTAREKNRNEALQKKIDAVAYYGEAVGIDTEQLNVLKVGLSVPPLTKTKLFQDILFFVAWYINDGRNGRNVAKVTNAIIRQYFDEEIAYSRQQNISLFTNYKYTYHGIPPFSLWHAD